MGEITKFVQLYVEQSDILPVETYKLARNLQNNIKKEAPYDQGRLKRSIRVDTRITDKYSIITGYWDEGIAPHGEYVVFGTKPHMIKPKSKKALHWGGKGGPFSKGHRHPGTKPNDFLGRGLLNTIANYR
jgi:hypothetical protein